MTAVHFYLPCTAEQMSRMPRRIEDYVEWQNRETEFNPFLGRFHWVLQPYLHLLAAGADVALTCSLPDEGIVYSHVDCLDYGLRSTATRMVVAALVDKDIPLPHAVLHLTHNPVQRLRFGVPFRYMPPLAQIGLVPRSMERGQRFENLYFVGNRENLHPFFTSAGFEADLRRLGLRLVVPPPSSWHDLSAADVILAVRNFGVDEPHLNKPALKLHNAWRAGVPAVLGYETAFRVEGRPGVDYVEALSGEAVVAALEQLAGKPAWRMALVDAGHEAARGFSDEAIRAQWMELLVHDLLPRYAAWRSRPGVRLACQLRGAVWERLLWRRPAAFAIADRAELASGRPSTPI